MYNSVTDVFSFKKQVMILLSTMAFFYKAAWVKKNWFWKYKIFIIILLTAKIDPEFFFNPRPSSGFPMLLSVATWH